MAMYGSDFNWTSGVNTYSYRSAPEGCTTGNAYSSAYPPGEATESQGPLVPATVIPGASVVVKITKTEDFGGKITVVSCKSATAASIGRGPWAPVVGDLTVIQGQCVTITVDVDTTKSSNNKLEIESSLIGDFCSQFPKANVCKDYDPKVTLPPSLRAGEAVAAATVAPANANATSATASNSTATVSNASSSTNDPTSSVPAKSDGVAVNRHSTRRVVLASLVGCVAVAMATL